MEISKPTYLIAELDGDVVPLVMEMRDRFNPKNLKWPVDITIAGSSGVGTVKEGQNLEQVVSLLRPIMEKMQISGVTFTEVSKFPNTGTYYLKPEVEPFNYLHDAVIHSGVSFNESPWPYNPHCSLRIGRTDHPKLQEFFENIELPVNSLVGCFSLYQPEANGGERIYRF